MEAGYFLIADVLGFSKIVENSTSGALDGQVDSWLALVDEARHAAELELEPQLISDTVFAAATGDSRGLDQLVRFGRYLLEHGVPKSLLVRGAITFGPYNWGRLTYGRAVIAAHQLEMAQDWIGISCDQIPHIEGHWGPDGLVCYPPPLKDAAIKLHPVVVWDVPDFEALKRSSLNEPLVLKGETLRWAWLRRIRNTRDFGIYLKTLPRNAPDWWKVFPEMTS